jgi:hypothetical protein
MNNKWKVIVIALITALALTMSLAAQNYQTDAEGGPESNTYKATAGIFGTDVDSFLWYHDYAGVEFDKWFGFAGYTASGTENAQQTTTGTIYKAALGYARRFGGIYLGAYYNGNIASLSGDVVTETINPTYNATTEQLTDVANSTYYSGAYTNSTNELDLLIGVAGQGIKLGFFESLSAREHPTVTSTDTDYQDGRVQHASEVVEYTEIAGHLRPVLGWGSVFNLGGFALKPWVEVGLDIYQDTLIDKRKATYTTYNGDALGQTITTNIAAGRNEGYIQPDITAAADVVFPKKGNSELTAGLEYNITFKIFDNAYDGSGISGSAKVPVTWVAVSPTTRDGVYDKQDVEAGNITFNDTTGAVNNITPAIGLTTDVTDRFKLGFKAKFPITIDTSSVDSYSDSHTITRYTRKDGLDPANDYTTTIRVHTPAGLVETTEFALETDFNVGASYVLVPDRFIVNAGIESRILRVSNKTEKTSANGVTATYTTTVNGNNETTRDTVDTVTVDPVSDRVTTTKDWVPFAARFRGGFTFLFTPKAALDFGFVSNSTPLPTAVAGATGFNADLASVNVLFTLKF